MMQFETFRGRTVQEAIAAVKAALGPDALIGSTRRVSNDRSGQLGTGFVEVTAAASLAAPSRSSQTFSRDATEPSPSHDTVSSRAPAARTGRFPVLDRTRVAVNAPRYSDDVIRCELGAIRFLLEEMTASQPPRNRAAAILHAARIEGRLARRLLLGAGRLRADSDVRAWLRERIRERLTVLPSPIEQPGRRLILCMGSTGVGKTTTVAKLAARARVELGRTTSILSLDTFRVGSIEQMRRFGELIGVPVDIASDAAGFRRALETRNPELAFVDTSSLPTSNAETLHKLRDCLAAAEGRVCDALLVVPAGIHARDAERLLTAYRDPAPAGVVMTKLDEAEQAGGAMHLALGGPVPVAYLCDGPRVPEDIREATVQAVLDGVIPVGGRHAD